ncbi:molybdate ABC transporter substrate-binding protein [Streptomyces sp. B6B3]|uniref:molybdate ABC transporter substrate-binding protein n=1 Tax=Streptomyces sp. B6B3 TaxID=3153570 RepID=UPI00325D3CD7
MVRLTAACAAVLLALSACSDSGSGSDASSSDAAGGPSGTVTVFAAASLEETFTALGEDFEEAHPGTEVEFSFGGSDSLAAGITGGAPADVFASASPATMEIVTEADRAAGEPTVFVRNQLQIATLPGNPHDIASLRDLADDELQVVLCDAEVPCGAAAQRVLDAAGIELTPVSYEQDVKSALTKVELREADAALVYRTDVNAAGDAVHGVAFPESAEAVNDYPIVELQDAPNADAARAFIDLVTTSAEGQRVLTDAGFLAP